MTATGIRFYHNPRCSKSRQSLKLLQDKGIEPVVIEYLKTPPDAQTVKRVLELLNREPCELMRKNEAEYQQLRLDDPELSRDDLIQAMVDHPILIERPIVVRGEHAVIGRPPENVLKIL